MPLDFWSPYFLGQLELASAALAAGLILESVLPRVGERSYRALAFNLVIAFIFIYLTTLLTPPLSALLDPIREKYSLAIPIAFPDGIAGSILQTLAFFFLFDFFFYWWHRAQHSVDWLWAQHKFHHQEQWLNVTTVHRYHFSEEPLRVLVILLPLALLFKFKPVTVGVIWTGFTLWGYWIHSNIRVSLGPVGRWVSGPQFHRHHHAPEYEHTNFAAFFPIWDRLFGTYHHPARGAFPETTGVNGENDGNTIYDGVVQPFVFWTRRLSHYALWPVRHLIQRSRVRVARESKTTQAPG
jgi:sterol desaturase/sphingolipid hydroxylase (fatty acid hydroxylase superfamily)